MMRARLLGGMAAVAFLGLSGCDWMPGKPTRAEQWQAPGKLLDFETLYMQNCNGCHGAQGTVAGSISLDDPTYLAIIPRDTLRSIIANGVPGKLMPAFSMAHGGLLTDEQIGILVDGIMAWAKNPPAGPLPAYAAAPGDATNGESIYAEYTASIAKSPAASMLKDGFLTNPAFLGLSSDQYLRTLVIVGRPEIGVPNYQNVIPGRPLSDQDIADVVAWLISQRKNEFGQPLVPAPPAPAQP
ncbi:MAG TPA: cytochrome c [Terrimicrobiaceae bacterium]|nr:cytochrome c [Terrimicrobiaceae bacterium]